MDEPPYPLTVRIANVALDVGATCGAFAACALVLKGLSQQPAMSTRHAIVFTIAAGLSIFSAVMSRHRRVAIGYAVLWGTLGVVGPWYMSTLATSVSKSAYVMVAALVLPIVVVFFMPVWRYVPAWRVSSKSSMVDVPDARFVILPSGGVVYAIRLALPKGAREPLHAIVRMPNPEDLDRFWEARAVVTPGGMNDPIESPPFFSATAGQSYAVTIFGYRDGAFEELVGTHIHPLPFAGGLVADDDLETRYQVRVVRSGANEQSS
jgi:hypothetical protein